MDLMAFSGKAKCISLNSCVHEALAIYFMCADGVFPYCFSDHIFPYEAHALKIRLIIGVLH